MVFTRRRMARRYKKRSRPMAVRRSLFGRRLALKYTRNYYKFKRFGVDCQMTGGTAGNGTIALNTTASGWALTNTSADVNGTWQFGGAMQFQLNQVLEHADMTQLFDKYKIKGVKVTIIPLGQPSTNATTSPLADTNYPTIAIAVDNDDASLPSSWNQVAVKQDCKIKKLNNPVSVYIRNPKMAKQIYDGATSAYSPGTGFIDCNYSDVPHYGLKFYVRECPLPIPPTVSGNGANVLFRIVTKFYLALKDPQ